MGNRAAADSKFGSDILLLPALEVKLDDLHVNRLQWLKWDVVSRWHGTVLLLFARWNLLKLYYFCLLYVPGAAGSATDKNYFITSLSQESFLYIPSLSSLPSLFPQFSIHSIFFILLPFDLRFLITIPISLSTGFKPLSFFDKAAGDPGKVDFWCLTGIISINPW